jgi:hypothetical protein
MRNTVASMKTENARATEAAQEQLSCIEMEGQLAFIMATFSSLTEGIKCLLEKGAKLEDSLPLVKTVAHEISGNVGKIVSRKIKVFYIKLRLRNSMQHFSNSDNRVFRHFQY